MTGPFVVLRNAADKKAFLVNVSKITHVFVNWSADKPLTCSVVLAVGDGLVLTVEGDFDHVRDLIDNALEDSR